MSKTAAQEEFDSFIAKNNTAPNSNIHPEDRSDVAHERALRNKDSEDEEDQFRASKIDDAMRMPTLDHRVTPSGGINLPPASFDSGRATGVKGVIADARSYENARKSKWSDRIKSARRSVFGGLESMRLADKSESEHSGDEDEENFLAQWRESRRRELESEDRSTVRNRRTSPSARIYGRFDEVDALGYLDAIEKVSRETTVVVYVYDHESQVSATIESALIPLVSQHPTIRFVKVHFEEIEFDNAGVPAVLAYRNQGDLFANLTAIIDMIPDSEDFDSDSLKRLFSKHNIL